MTSVSAQSGPHIHSYLNLCHWNAQSICNKTTTCSDYVIDHHADIMFLTETWMGGDTDKVVIGELSPPGYTFINIPRPNDCHGGIGVLHRQSLKLQVYPSTFTAISFEYVIIVDTVNEINFVVTYRPYPSPVNKFTASQFLTEFDDFLLYVNGLSGKIILLGDYNIQVDNPCGPGVTHFLSSIDGVGLTSRSLDQRTGVATHLFLSRPEENLIKSCIVGPRLSDHNMVLCKLDIRRPEDQKEVISTRNISVEKFECDFQNALSSQDTINKSDDNVNTYISNLEFAITSTLDMYATATLRTRCSRVHQPWYYTEIHRGQERPPQVLRCTTSFTLSITNK